MLERSKMAYNLQTLIQILEQILQTDEQRRIVDQKNKPQLESLLEKASCLQEIFGSYSPALRRKTETLEIQIRDATHKAEDLIESHIVNRILSETESQSFVVSPLDLQHVIDEFDSAMNKLMNIVDQTLDKAPFMPAPSPEDIAPKTSTPGVSFAPDPCSENFVVGLDEDAILLKDRLTLGTKLEVIPVVGMGGIGKTTLARNLYNDPLIAYHFDICAWVTISQEYSIRTVLVGLLSCITGDVNDEMLKKKNDDELKDTLYKSLFGRRYLIILDDMWATDVWDDNRMLFPDNNNGSRIMLTTRELEVANYANSSSPHHQMRLLNEVKSWNLLCGKVFGKENCPQTLEYIGKTIARNCSGLPLAIQVIGGLLSEVEKTKDFWKHVANDVSSTVAEKNEQFSKILSLSYDHLPEHLRPCFLYLGAFPEDYEIPASKLIRLWVAEGFLKPIAKKTLEEAAEVYLKALVDRNLILVRKQEYSNGKVKSYSIHDLLRDLCMRRAVQEKFIHATKHHSIEGPFDNMPLIRSFVAIEIYSWHSLVSLFTTSRLLRVLDLFKAKFDKFPEEILQLVNLRYLAFNGYLDSLSVISRLWNLQTFILWGSSKLSYKLGAFTHIRHLKLKKGCCLVSCSGENIVLEKLQTLSCIDAYSLTRSEFFERFPNLRKLGMYWGLIRVIDLSRLYKLETLKCSSYQSRISPPCVTFPPSIKKLTLSDCMVHWEFMSAIGSLPNLEVLKILKCNFVDQDKKLSYEWESIEGEFLSLQFLLLRDLKLEHWRADESHFPRLHQLVIRNCSELEEIPHAIGDIPTMEIIEVDKWSRSAMASATLIREEKLELGNVLQVRIHGWE